MAKKRRRLSRISAEPARPAPPAIPTISSAQADIGRNALMLQDTYRAEVRAAKAERELAEIRRKLVGLLNPDQIEAAKVCGVTAEFYALECIELYKEKFFPHMPAQLRPLGILNATGGTGL